MKRLIQPTTYSQRQAKNLRHLTSQQLALNDYLREIKSRYYAQKLGHQVSISHPKNTIWAAWKKYQRKKRGPFFYYHIKKALKKQYQ